MLSKELGITKEDVIRGVDNDEFFLEFQPQFGINCDVIEGAEALVRWAHPVHGTLYPNSFINFIESNKYLVNYLGSYVYANTIKASSFWKKKTGRYLSVSVNLGVKQLEDPALVDWVMNISKEYHVPPRFVKVEVTENAVPTNIVAIKRTLELFSINGFKVSIDDFGTGGATMNYLRLFPVHQIKIDKSFSETVPYNEEANKLCLALIAFADKMGFEVVVEGIENSSQLEFFKRAGATLYQGYLLSKPIRLEKMLNIDERIERSLHHGIVNI